MIDFNNVSKNYGARQLLNQVSFRINSGDRVGVVGPNGAGKSTIFHMITGELSPDKGEISLPKGERIGCLQQFLEPGNESRSLVEFTADAIAELRSLAEELHNLEHELHTRELAPEEQEQLLKRHGSCQTRYEHLGGYQLRNEAEAALCGLGFLPEQLEKPLSQFSGGWQMRAMLARTLIANPDILLLDEPSNYLDIPAVEWLCRFLNNYPGTMLLISHDRFLLNKLTNITLEVNSGSVTRYAGNYDFYRTERANRQLALENAKRNTDKRREELQKNIDRFRAKATKAAQAKSWQKQLDRIEEITLPEALQFHSSIRLPEPPPCGAESARWENVTFAYPNQATPVLQNVNLALDTGDKVAIIGYNGTGKSTLLKLLAGTHSPQSGKVIVGHNVILGYQAQEFSDVLNPEKSVYDVVRAAVKRDFPLNNIPNVLGSFGFSGEDMNKLCKVLSGGEKIRLCFARIFVNPPNLLILDEPTTHLDVAAREALQEVLTNYKGTVCFVSHDIEFVRNVAVNIVAMQNNGVKKYYGNYDYYLQKIAEETVQTSSGSSSSSSGSKAPVEKDNARDKRRERAQKRQAIAGIKKAAEQEVARLEKKMEKQEARQAEIIALLSGSSMPENFADLSRELTTLKLEIDHTAVEWEIAFEKLEEIRNLNQE